MNVFEELQAVPEELLTEAQIRRRDKMKAVVADYSELKEKCGGSSLVSTNRICEILAKKHDIAVRTARYYLVDAELIES